MKTIHLTFFRSLFALGLAFAAGAPSLSIAAESKPTEKKTPASAAKPKPYPLDVCLVTDNDLGSMGEETTLVYEGQILKFCCKPCEAKFLKNPVKYLAKLPSKNQPAK